MKALWQDYERVAVESKLRAAIVGSDATVKAGLEKLVEDTAADEVIVVTDAYEHADSRNCREGKTGICLNVNGDRAGGAFGYVDMGGWIGGQAEYVMAPYADFNLLKFPDKDQALEKIEDLTLLSDIFPTGYDGAVKAGVTTGSTVYVAGAGPVGLACAAACQLLGAAVVIVGDMIPERLAQARSFGCETLDLRERIPLGERIAQILGVPEVDSAVDCVGFEAKGQAEQTGTEQPATVLNSLMEPDRHRYDSGSQSGPCAVGSIPSRLLGRVGRARIIGEISLYHS